jgi:hypothetical protein
LFRNKKSHRSLLLTSQQAAGYFLSLKLRLSHQGAEYGLSLSNKNTPVLNFFRPIIPLEDFEALNSALYLREVFLSNGDVSKLKQDIRKRFGDRGNTIANLCTAGYFEKFLMPLYNSSKEKFNELYEIIVAKSVLAIFVHSDMTQEQIPKEITYKLEISTKYGIKFIHIHGIGILNVNKIKKTMYHHTINGVVCDRHLFLGCSEKSEVAKQLLHP